jgi:hypothetical protein
MSYIGTSINNSATIVAKASVDIADGDFLAAKFSSGKIAICGTSGENALGLIIPGQDGIQADDDVNVQIKDIGLWKTGAGVSAGAELTTDANGKAITATAGAFILAIALEDAATANAVIKVQVIKAGYKAGGSVAPLTLAGLTDVNISGIQDGEVLTYDTNGWVNDTPSVPDLEDLGDVEITTATDGDTLTYDDNDSKWKNKQ